MNHNLQSQNNAPIIESSRGLIQEFMAQVYGWMSCGLLLTAIVAWYISQSTFIEYFYQTPALLIGIVIAQFALVFALSGAINRLSPAVATSLFMLYSAMTGVILSSIFIIYTDESIVGTFVITSAMFAATSIYGYVTKRDLTGVGSFMFMGLIGLVIASLVNFWLKSPALTWAISYIGVFVFLGLTAHDTQKLKEIGDRIDSEDKSSYRKLAITGALTLYLDFINLFIFLLRIVGDRR